MSFVSLMFIVGYVIEQNETQVNTISTMQNMNFLFSIFVLLYLSP